MNLRGILSIATYPGLYRHVAQAKNGLIIESIVDGKRSLAYATSRISALEDISIYTTDGDTKLSEVYTNLFKVLEGKLTPYNPKKASEKDLVDLFEKVLPNWDKDRVYISDIKRAFSWYNILVDKGFGNEPEATEEASITDATPEVKESQPNESNKAAEPTDSVENVGEIKVKKRTKKRTE